MDVAKQGENHSTLMYGGLCFFRPACWGSLHSGNLEMIGRGGGGPRNRIFSDSNAARLMTLADSPVPEFKARKTPSHKVRCLSE